MTSSSGRNGAVPTTGSVRLPPDPRSLASLGRNHTLEAAVAELIDNSIDAGARHALVRFVRDRERLIRLLIVDDGSGIDGDRIDVAMTVGGSRHYREEEIGRFGLGMKAASFSQARSVTVLSTAGEGANGRRWHLDKAKRDYSCEIVDPAFASAELAADWGFTSSKSGTIVRWDELANVPTVMREADLDRYLQETFARVRAHIGLVFHRILERDGMRVLLDVEDEGNIVLRTEVPAVNPFGYSKTGAAGWPKKLRAGDDRRGLTLECHIWPGRSNADEFRLDGNLIERQGLYIYLNDRLIQSGGWSGLCHPDKQLNLARVAISISGDVPQMLVLRAEKSSIEAGPDFAREVFASSAPDGTSFSNYLERARGVFKDANRRRRVRTAISPPGAGFSPRLRRAFLREFPITDDEPVDIRWADLYSEDFFDVDREQRVLWLNSRYRKRLAGGRPGSLNDLPVVKALMFLLVENIFTGQNIGPRDRDNLELWQELLTAAAKEERS